jgi:outer membrane protein OmpA-like peptidoglycan-associated protein
MKNHVVARCLLSFALLIALGTVGCAGRKTYLHAEAVTASGVRVSPADVFSNGSVLVVKINVSNQAKSPIVVDREAMRLVLADGRILSPVSHADKAKTLDPQASDLLRIDFRSDGFKWKEVSRAQLRVSEAVILRGAPAPIPPMELVLGDLRGPPLAQLEQNQITIYEQIQFRTGSAEILPESAPIVIAIAEILANTPKIGRLRVEGHTDNKGVALANLDLSRRRATAVVAALIARGVSRDRLVSSGLGDAQPLETNATEDGRQSNRRVEFHIEH